MRYSLRVALAAILTVVSAGTSFGQIGSPSAFVQFNPGTPLGSAAQSALVLSSVTIYPGAQMDLTSGGMVVDANNFNYYAPNGSGGYVLETGTVAINDAVANMWGTTITGQSSSITYGSGGNVTGDQTNGVFSSANINGNQGYVGFIENSNTQFNTWRGVNLNSSTVQAMGDPTLIGYTYAGDIYMEGYSDSGDLVPIDGNITNQAIDTTWSDGDIYYEGYSDSGDLVPIDGNITNQPAPLYAAPSALGGVVSAPSSTISAVPEPASVSMVLAAIASIAFLSRRRVTR